MTADLIAGAGAFVVAALGALVWYANRAEKNAASVKTSEAATAEAVLQRLRDGSA